MSQSQEKDSKIGNNQFLARKRSLKNRMSTFHVGAQNQKELYLSIAVFDVPCKRTYFKKKYHWRLSHFKKMHTLPKILKNYPRIWNSIFEKILFSDVNSISFSFTTYLQRVTYTIKASKCILKNFSFLLMQFWGWFIHFLTENDPGVFVDF